MKQKASNFTVFNLTQSVAPNVSELINKRYEWVWFGDDNLFPQKLVTLGDNSAVHAAVLNLKSKMIAGDGLIDEEGQGIAFLETIIGDIEMFLTNTAVDLAYYNGFYTNILYDQIGRPAKLMPVDFSAVRAGRLEEMKIPRYWISADWRVGNKKNLRTDEEMFRPFSVPSFDPLKYRDSESRKNGQIIATKKYKPSKLFYPESDYLAALNYIEIAAQIADFHKNSLSHGMIPSLHLHVFEDLSDTAKREEIEKRINEKFTGTSNAGKVILTWSTGLGMEPRVTPVEPNNAHQMFSLLNDMVTKEIVTAHRVPTILAGIPTSTGLSSQGLGIKESLEMFQNTEIAPMQRMIERMLNEVLAVAGIDAKVSIANAQPFSFLASDAIIQAAMSRDEIRTEILGLDPEGDVQTDENIEENGNV